MNLIEQLGGYEEIMRGAGFMIRCHRCGKLKEPNQFRKLKPVWCTWCINCENTPIGIIAKWIIWYLKEGENERLKHKR